MLAHAIMSYVYRNPNNSYRAAPMIGPIVYPTPSEALNSPLARVLTRYFWRPLNRLLAAVIISGRIGIMRKATKMPEKA